MDTRPELARRGVVNGARLLWYGSLLGGALVGGLLGLALALAQPTPITKRPKPVRA